VLSCFWDSGTGRDKSSTPEGIAEIVIAVALMAGNPSTFGQVTDPTTFAAKSSILGYAQIKPNVPEH